MTRLLAGALLAAAAFPLTAAEAATCTKPDEPVCAVYVVACDAVPADLHRTLCL